MSMLNEVSRGGSHKKAAHKGKKKLTFKEMFIPQRNDSTKVLTSKIITLAAFIVLLICLVVLGSYFYEMLEAKANNNKIKDMVRNAGSSQTIIPQMTESPLVTLSPTDSEDGDPAQTEYVRPPLPPLLSYAQTLLAENPDTVGYVRIPGCIEEPVVKGTDNSYYLTHNFFNKKRQCGTCFADYRNNLDPYDRSDNIVLYAHNQKDGTMFGNMDYYRWDPAYWLKNPFVYFNTNYTEDTYVIISSFVVNTLPEHDNGREVFDYQNYINFDDSSYTYEHFSSEITKRSTIITGVDYNRDDKYLTLSTCSTEFDESRHVIVARMLRDGETEDSIDTTAFQKNPNPKWPAIYYKYNGGTYIDEDEQ